MGLANLVPGVSGGTMLLASGVYPALIRALEELSRLRMRWDSAWLVGTVVAAAALAIGFFAGPVRALVIAQRWMMYSLFVGLTLGGVPLVWRLARPATPTLWIGVAAGIALVLPMAFGPLASGRPESSAALLALSGLAAASAMILPGISGSYLLLLLGQYEGILGAVDQLGHGLTAWGVDPAPISEALGVLVPVAAGVVLGVAAGSRMVGWLLRRHSRTTHGVLLGLLLGSALGLWPFQAGVRPEAGDWVSGRALTASEASQIDREQWPVRRFVPDKGQSFGSLGLIATGLLATTFLGRLGRAPESGG